MNPRLVSASAGSDKDKNVSPTANAALVDDLVDLTAGEPVDGASQTKSPDEVEDGK